MKKKYAKLVVLAGSKRSAPPGKLTKKIRSAELMDVTVKLKAGKPLPDLLNPAVQKEFKPLSRETFAEQYGASSSDVAELVAYAQHAGLTVAKIEASKRTVTLRGTIAQMEKAFQVRLSQYKDSTGCEFRGRQGEIRIPAELEGIVEGVFGLDTRPIATPKFKVLKGKKGKVGKGAKDGGRDAKSGGRGVKDGKAGKDAKGGRRENSRMTGTVAATATATPPYFPTQIAELYNFPTGVTGKGQCIGIIELGGGYETADISNYFQQMGLPAPNVVAISIDGGHNSPTNANSADGEVLLDIEVAAGIAPDATIAVYFAGNTNQAFLDAINTAIHDTQNNPSVISISWGSAEGTAGGWTTSSLNAFNESFQAAATMGITVCAAAGDDGSNDNVNDQKVHVDFPASSPYVLACGGTKLTTSGDTIDSEIVWNEDPPGGGATGGGVSDVFPLPSYQAGAGVPLSLNTKKTGRGVPDIAADADPNTGYTILVDGEQMQIGGTSAVAPMMAGLLARINQQKGKPAGFIHPVLYANPSVCRDITQGNNITVTKGTGGYTAGPGYDACSGLGVPDGIKLMNVL
ncbi:MAG: S53 family peptidase [Puia sp.]|nr:S53 family peptidase [Puia sp.]